MDQWLSHLAMYKDSLVKITRPKLCIKRVYSNTNYTVMKQTEWTKKGLSCCDCGKCSVCVTSFVPFYGRLCWRILSSLSASMHILWTNCLKRQKMRSRSKASQTKIVLWQEGMNNIHWSWGWWHRPRNWVLVLLALEVNGCRSNMLHAPESLEMFNLRTQPTKLQRLNLKTTINSWGLQSKPSYLGHPTRSRKNNRPFLQEGKYTWLEYLIIMASKHCRISKSTDLKKV